MHSKYRKANTLILLCIDYYTHTLGIIIFSHITINMYAHIQHFTAVESTGVSRFTARLPNV